MKTLGGLRFGVMVGVSLSFVLGMPNDGLGSDERQKAAALAPMQRTPVRSSSVASIGYDSAARALEIEFRSGTIYRYFDVAAGCHQKFLSAESKGRYFMGEIRGKYKFQRVEGPGK